MRDQTPGPGDDANSESPHRSVEREEASSEPSIDDESLSTPPPIVAFSDTEQPTDRMLSTQKVLKETLLLALIQFKVCFFVS